MMEGVALKEFPVRPAAHPNGFDRKRIERALKARRRYRYVVPQVAMVVGGYRIESPCCSRNVDPEGRTVDIALLLYDQGRPGWELLRKDHGSGTWQLHSRYDRLIELLEHLNSDPERAFWQ